jgi:hypothetical protein
MPNQPVQRPLMVRGLAIPFIVFHGVVGAKWEQTPLLTPDRRPAD